jgi:16S rRNA (guanine966-N2)-methyltransferase
VHHFCVSGSPFDDSQGAESKNVRAPLQHAFCVGRGRGETLRVTGGKYRGRRLRAPKGDATRPTSDRVRESLFAWLPDLSGTAVLDLYAGTGALGIEALSRGAARAVFVERGRPALAALAANLADLELGTATRVLRTDVRAALGRLARESGRYDAIFMDPPYGAKDAIDALRAIGRDGLLAPEGMLVFETSRRHPLGDVEGLMLAEERGYGDTIVVCYVTSSRNASDAEDRPQ